MCGFTLVLHKECGHHYISTTPEHTRLCGWATDRHLQQGVDSAPPPCSFTEEIDTTLIVGTHELFNHCDNCRNEVEIVPRGEDEGVLQKHAHVKEDAIGVYDEAEDEELKSLRDYIVEREKRGIELQKEFDAYVDTQPGGLSHLQLSVFFSQLQPAGYQGLYLNKLQACISWFPVLEQLKAQRAPNKLFADTLLWVFSQAERVSLILDRLGDVLDCLRQFEPSKRKERTEQSSGETDIDFNGSEAQLDYMVYFLILQHSGSGEELPNPNFAHFFSPEIRPSFNTLLTFRIREAVNRFRNNKPIPRSVQKHKRYEAGKMNIHNLAFELHKGLLEEEPASKLEAEHIKIPNVDHTKRIDVEDEHGNRLVWNVDGTTSKLIFTGSAPEPCQPTKQVVDQLQDQSRTQTGGYGFAYSDGDSEPEDDRAQELPDLSVAGGILGTEVDKSEQPEEMTTEDGDDPSEFEGKHSLPSSPQRKRASLSFVNPNRKLKPLRARQSKGDMVAGSASMQDSSVAQVGMATEEASSSASETGIKRKHEGGQGSNGRSGGFGFAEEVRTVDSSSSLPSLSGPASPALPSSPPPYEPIR
jgi:hypothetical protein